MAQMMSRFMREMFILYKVFFNYLKKFVFAVNKAVTRMMISYATIKKECIRYSDIKSAFIVKENVRNMDVYVRRKSTLPKSLKTPRN